MRYSEEEIKRYLSILHIYTKQTVDVPSEVSRKPKCKNCQRDDCFTIYSGFKVFLKTVAGKMVMFWDIMIIKIMIDYIIERRVFIREDTIMKKRSIKFVKYYS